MKRLNFHSIFWTKMVMECTECAREHVNFHVMHLQWSWCVHLKRQKYHEVKKMCCVVVTQTKRWLTKFKHSEFSSSMLKVVICRIFCVFFSIPIYRLYAGGSLFLALCMWNIPINNNSAYGFCGLVFSSLKIESQI